MLKRDVHAVKIDVPVCSTVLQTREIGGEEFPRFRFHERDSLASNCRIGLFFMEAAE